MAALKILSKCFIDHISIPELHFINTGDLFRICLPFTVKCFEALQAPFSVGSKNLAGSLVEDSLELLGSKFGVS